MFRALRSFPLSSGQQEKLRAAGFETAEDLKDVSIIELSKELCITTSESLEILNVVHGTKPTTSSDCSGLAQKMQSTLPQGQSALELLKVEQTLSFIVTFSAKVDEMLGGGIPLGKITELCGAPGIGKTQFSMQLAVDVAIPELFGGVEGEAIYIDTEGSFIVERVAEIAAAAVQHIANVAGRDSESDDPEMMKVVKDFTLESVLKGIHYFRCHDYIELVALVNILPQFLSQHRKVKLVVVDSVASPFRHGFTDMGMRNRILSGMAQNLIKLATLNSIAVVLTNQMTTKPHPHSQGPARLVPALGESWGHLSTIRVVLYWSQYQRYAMLYKSPTRKESVVGFQVTNDGIRDLGENLSAEEGVSSSQEVLKEWCSLTSSQLDDLVEEEQDEDLLLARAGSPGLAVQESRKRS